MFSPISSDKNTLSLYTHKSHRLYEKTKQSDSKNWKKKM